MGAYRTLRLTGLSRTTAAGLMLGTDAVVFRGLRHRTESAELYPGRAQGGLRAARGLVACQSPAGQ
jgi:hypothetical protein